MSFLKQGLRKNIVDKRKKVKYHTREFYKILGSMNELTQTLKETVTEEITEDNINEIVKPIYGRELDNFEKMIVLSKLEYEKDTVESK